MIPQEMAALELAKVESEIIRWVVLIERQKARIRNYPGSSGIDLELARQILQTFEAALQLAYARRNRLLER